MTLQFCNSLTGRKRQIPQRLPLLRKPIVLPRLRFCPPPHRPQFPPVLEILHFNTPFLFSFRTAADQSAERSYMLESVPLPFHYQRSSEALASSLASNLAELSQHLDRILLLHLSRLMMGTFSGLLSSICDSSFSINVDRMNPDSSSETCWEGKSQKPKPYRIFLGACKKALDSTRYRCLWWATCAAYFENAAARSFCQYIDAAVFEKYFSFSLFTTSCISY